MQLFRKIYVSAFGSVESVVNRLQNHDALAAVSLQDLDGKIREAQIAFGTLSRTLKKFEVDIAQAERDENLWCERAKSEGARGAKDAAIECLKRSHQARNTKEALTKQRVTSEVAHQRLQASITELQNLQKTLTLRHRELKARAEIEGAQSFTSTITGNDLQEILGRWEDSLGGEVFGEVDTFESKYTAAEEQAVLEAELAALSI